MTIRIEQDTMTASVHQTPLPEVLRELEQHLPIQVSLHDALEQPSITATVIRQPIDDGIKALLRGFSYVLVYDTTAHSPRPQGSTALRALVVLGPSSATDVEGHASRSSSEPVSAVSSGSFQQTASDPNLPERPDVLEASLRERSPEIRSATLTRLYGTHTVPVATVATLAQEDADPTLRMQALTVLSRRSPAAARTALEHAQSDPNAEVRQLAADLLSSLSP